MSFYFSYCCLYLFAKLHLRILNVFFIKVYDNKYSSNKNNYKRSAK